MEIDIDRDMPADAYNLYIAPFSSDFGAGKDFYGGLQTNIGGWPAASPGIRSGPYHKGKGAIFSRWGEGLDLSFVRQELDGLVEAADYEGDFVSGRRPFPWKAGIYIFEIRLLSTEKINGEDWAWVGAFVREKRSPKSVQIAVLRFPGRTLRLSGKFVSFIEFYSGKDVDIARLPPLTIRFSRPVLNGHQAALGRVSVHHPVGPNEPASPALMTAELSQDGMQVICRLHEKVQTERPIDYELYPRHNH